ncbi:MAG TPA: DnaD domain protein, partial [Firmicutes bacterium]|nr:DnaD domain protein [Bacillota bacterium]
MSARQSKKVILRGFAEHPLQIPREIFRHQAVLGPVPTLVWINLLALTEQRRPFALEEIAERMGLTLRQVKQALALLADFGWLNDQGLEIQLTVPEPSAAERETAAGGEGILNEEQASFEWLIGFCSARIQDPSPEEMRKLHYWMQDKGLSHEVIAVAVEEMFAQASQPSFRYLEGILRNWHGMGIRTYNDLLENPNVTQVLAALFLGGYG